MTPSRDAVSSPDVQTRRFPVIWTGVVIHAGLVVVLFLALLVTVDDRQNIGSGLATIPLAVLDFPWSVLIPQASGPAGASLDVALFLAALANVGIHAGVIWAISGQVAAD